MLILKDFIYIVNKKINLLPKNYIIIGNQKMNILEHYYNDNKRRLYVEFSTKDDGDDFYRVLELGFEDIQYYSPTIIIENDLYDIDEDFILELLEQYLTENDLPEEQNL